MSKLKWLLKIIAESFQTGLVFSDFTTLFIISVIYSVIIKILTAFVYSKKIANSIELIENPQIKWITECCYSGVYQICYFWVLISWIDIMVIVTGNPAVSNPPVVEFAGGPVYIIFIPLITIKVIKYFFEVIFIISKKYFEKLG